jgi:hypothetical protein
LLSDENLNAAKHSSATETTQLFQSYDSREELRRKRYDETDDSKGTRLRAA